jgi:hypothetical protein
MSSKGDEARAELVLSNRSEQIGGAAVANLFVFGMAVFLGGLCWLAARVVLWAAETKAEHSGDVGPLPAGVLVEIPDTVPSEWVEAYQAERDG